MQQAGINDGDILIVDRSLEARPGSIVVAAIDGELTIKRLRKENGQVWLMAANDLYKLSNRSVNLNLGRGVRHRPHLCG
jgi:DNA polymerase V